MSHRSRRILHIIAGLGDGGAESALFRLCSYGGINDHHVVSLTDGGKYGPLLEARGITVTCLNMPRRRVTPSGLWKLWRTIRTSRPDVIQTWMYHADFLGGVIGRLAGRSNIIWGIRHTTLVPGESSRSTIIIARICAFLSWYIPKHIVCCAERSLLVHSEMGYDLNRMKVIPNGYDFSVFQPDPSSGERFRVEMDIESDFPLIGFVARFDPLKDHENLIHALSILEKKGILFNCLLVGTDMDKNNVFLKDMISRYKLDRQIHLMGRRSDIPAIMNALDLHVMSSMSEGFPNVLAEAMACGTPCVSTDVGDAKSILGDTGWIVPIQDPQALSDVISVALQEISSPKYQERKRAAHHRIIENFSIDRMVESYNNLWFSNSV